MNKVKSVVAMVSFTALGVLMSFVFNFFILEQIIIPDPCYYHSHDTTKLFDLFYELKASEGYHPTGTKLNFVLTVMIGGILGLMVGVKRTKKISDVERS